MARKNHHGQRSESGRALPGKKLAKQKSNGHLNGLPNGFHQASSNTPPTPTTTPPATASRAEVAAASIPPSVTAASPSFPYASARTPQNLDGQLENGYGSSNGSMGAVTKKEAGGRASGSVQVNGSNGHALVSSTSVGGDAAMSPNGHHTYSAATCIAAGDRLNEHFSRRADRMAPAVKKAYPARKGVNPLVLASTILKACPTSDTIAILILLLQLPPIVLTLVQFLYASMTFMLPAGVSTGTLTSNFDIFQGPAGTPSLSTMIAMDGFCLLVWGLFMWNWAKNFAIDLAHVQVAIALGAGSSGGTGGVNTFCVSMVLIVHLLRSEGIQTFLLSHLFSAKLLSPETVAKYSYLIPAEFRRQDSSSPPSWIGSLLAVHILAQAGTAMARRSMAKNRSSPRAKSSERSATDTSAAVTPTLSDISSIEPSTALSSGISSEPAQPSSSLKDTKERVSTAKKRRRQANEARRIQPFWAALASTKFTVTREYERSRNGNWYSPNAPTSEDDLDGVSPDNAFIWITGVDTSTIEFAANDFNISEDAVAEGAAYGAAGPFYVLVNGAHWAPVSLSKVTDSSKDSPIAHWRGEISGLAPDCTYTCSFVCVDTNEEVCVVSVKTPSAPVTDQVVTPPVALSPQQSLRPSSPSTTIKNSIVNAEAKLNERRSRLKRSRNNHKLHLSKVKRELDGLTHRLLSGGDESRQRQRSLQLERTIRQTEDATAGIEAQLEKLENLSGAGTELEEWNARKAVIEAETSKLKALRQEVEDAKVNMAKAVTSSEAELASAVQKRERLQSRLNRLTAQHERIVSSTNAQDLAEREQQAQMQMAQSAIYNSYLPGAFVPKVPARFRLIPACGGDPNLFIDVEIASEPASNIQNIFRSDLYRLNYNPLTYAGIEQSIPVEFAIETSNGVEIEVEVRESLRIHMQILTPNGVPITPWYIERAAIIEDDQAIITAGGSMGMYRYAPNGMRQFLPYGTGVTSSPALAPAPVHIPAAALSHAHPRTPVHGHGNQASYVAPRQGEVIEQLPII
ncbi:ubiquitination network signaling protein [Trichophyton violaceum]|uniref:Ubiquitination network signaling protein n=1 Tax=Trichophyton violaceum TaxID=34388 RepID=A0A178FFC9_TRIVO|nr:ubiquitination network signaling protein [Trichophyton violaceum]